MRRHGTLSNELLDSPFALKSFPYKAQVTVESCVAQKSFLVPFNMENENSDDEATRRAELT
jgi:hypothetical protein